MLMLTMKNFGSCIRIGTFAFGLASLAVMGMTNATCMAEDRNEAEDGIGEVAIPEIVVKKLRVQGVLKHHPQDVKSVEAWMGREFSVDGTGILPTDEVPAEELRKLAGKTVVVEGVWNPGKRWEPTPEDAILQTPSFGKEEVVMKGAGIEAAEVEIVEEKEE